MLVKKKMNLLLYTSSMHGDELAGYVLSLRLIDYFLNEYTDNPKVKV